MRRSISVRHLRFRAGPLAVLHSLTSLAPLLSADTLRVGPPGSGAAFSEIQAAVDAAEEGDLILVQAGTYSPITIGKSLRILGAGSDHVLVEGFGQTAVTIRGIAATGELVISGLRVHTSNPFSVRPVVRVEDCPGTVVLRDLRVDPEEISIVGFQIDSCDRVVVLGCFLEAGLLGISKGAVVVEGSEVWIANCEILGVGDHMLGSRGAPGVEAIDSTVRIWRTRLVGGDSTGKGGLSTTSLGGSGILATGSMVHHLGGPTSSIVGGHSGFTIFEGDFPGAPGLDLRQGSRVHCQEDIPIEGGLDGSDMIQAPDVMTDATSVVSFLERAFPTLAVSPLATRFGTRLELTLAGSPKALQAVFAAPRTGGVALPFGVGPWLLDPTTAIPIASGILSAEGMLTITTSVSLDTSAMCPILFLQGIEFSGGRVVVGNPELVRMFNP